MSESEVPDTDVDAGADADADADVDAGVVRWLFVNGSQGRLRAGWRVLVQTVLLVVVFVVAALVVGVGVGVALGANPFGLSPVTGLVVASVTTLVAVVVSVPVAARFIDRRSMGNIGLSLDRTWWGDLVFGLALGATLMTVVFVVELALGWVVVTGTFVASGGSVAVQAGTLLFVFLCVGVYEELLSRGYHLTNAAEGLNGLGGLSARGAIAVASVLSAATFAALHAGNPSASFASTAGIFVAGLFLAAGYVLTGRLGIPVGVHVTWNFFQSVVYGFPVSGIPVSVSVVAIEQRGPELLTGGSFGPEAGVLGAGAALFGIVAVAGWVRVREGGVSVRTEVATYAPRRDVDPGSGPEMEPSAGGEDT